jgi:hypothetical protein
MRPTRKLAALIISSRLVLPKWNLLTNRAPFWEESLGPDSGLMSRRKGAFTCYLLPIDCDFKAEAEPKHNMVLIFENDFSSKLV